ncbi:MAG: hypothetical protein ACRDS9_16640 [Pseudonocardiaceae bacterium]
MIAAHVGSADYLIFGQWREHSQLSGADREQLGSFASIDSAAPAGIT